MNQDPADNPLREKVWRRELSAPELAELRAWLASHPGAQSDWEAEEELSRLLNRLPDAPVPSNFTSRVLQAVERETHSPLRTKPARPWWLRVLVPRAAVAGAVLGLGLFGYQRYEITNRDKLVKGLTAITSAPSLPNPEDLEDFETIRRLPPAPDQELLALMQ